MRGRGKDLYQILNVEPTADLETIRVAYRNLAKRYHPDINTSPDAKARMQEINDAYRTLSNPSKRVWYDIARERERVRRRAYRRPRPPRQDWRRTHTPPRREGPEPPPSPPPRTQYRSSAASPESSTSPGGAASRPWTGIPFSWWWLLAPIISLIFNFDFTSGPKYRSNLQKPTATIWWIDSGEWVESDQEISSTTGFEIPDWPIAIEEDFGTNKVPLLKGSFKGQFTSGSRLISDGKYHWDITVNTQRYFDVVYYSKSFSDFYLSVDIEKLHGSKASRFGVRFRCPNAYDGYLFYVTNSGLFTVSVLDDDRWIPLIDWTYSSAINSINSNRLVVLGKGTHFDFYINGEHVGDLTDTRFDIGKIGLAVGFEKDATGEYTFDNIVVRQPQEMIDERTPYPTLTPAADSTGGSIPQIDLEDLNLMIKEDN